MLNSGKKQSQRAKRASAGNSSTKRRRSYKASQKNGADAKSFARSSYGSSSDSPIRPLGSAGSSGSAGGRAAQSSHSRYMDANSREYVRLQRLRRKKTRRLRVALTCVIVVAVLALTGVGAAWAYLAQIDQALHRNVDEDLLSSLAVTDSPSDPFYMLLIGADRSEERDASGMGSYRTDSMILTRVDPRQKTVTMISIPRDTRVAIPGYGTDKINAAYAYGGPALAVETVSELAGVEINHYAEIDFDGFKAVVDALGGVEVNVPMEIDDDLAGGYVPAGQQTLNGDQALIFARSRHTYDDYGAGDHLRAANQRALLTAIMQKVMSSDLGTLTNTVSTLAQYVTTDFSVASIVGLAQSMQGIDVDSNVYTAACPVVSSYEGDVWWDILQEAEWEAMMERVDAGLSPTEESQVDENTGIVMSTTGDGGTASSSSNSTETVSLSGVTISVKNGSGIAGCAADAASRLTPQGAVVTTGNADDFNYPSTLVIYDNPGDLATAEAIAAALGVGEPVQNDGRYVYADEFLVVVGGDWS